MTVEFGDKYVFKDMNNYEHVFSQPFQKVGLG